MGSVDRRVESEDSGDEEGRRRSSSIGADLDEHSLRDGEERKEEDLQGTGHTGDLGPPWGLGEAGVAHDCAGVAALSVPQGWLP